MIEIKKINYKIERIIIKVTDLNEFFKFLMYYLPQYSPRDYLKSPYHRSYNYLYEIIIESHYQNNTVGFNIKMINYYKKWKRKRNIFKIKNVENYEKIR